ncbi:hypothetical protein AXF42_Ash018451 [Apostasia shenzhenica]|uniref:Retrovirus-related Pol polyprotein from transposon TNT 1-94-like beta-barrel domain-containing protein n=1 Tax=Apostasia shenzhenica TaxID=1088818 RepID=A0A2I0BED6_9ASPA|nr:hypothetical protein AXF42_Ash018451 [Apostasia shenzhenica]
MSIFLDIDTSVISKVRIGNRALAESKRKGAIAIETKKGVNYTRNVLLVLELEQNLLSVRRLIQNSII